MASLLKAIRASLIEVNLGLKGDLTISENMERIVLALATDVVPASWAQLAYPSLRPLSTWLPDLCQRASQLSEWVASFALPSSLWISGKVSLIDCVVCNKLPFVHLFISFLQNAMPTCNIMQIPSKCPKCVCRFV